MLSAAISEESETLTTVFDLETNKNKFVLFKIVFTCLLQIIEIVPSKKETEEQFGDMKDKI